MWIICSLHASQTWPNSRYTQFSYYCLVVAIFSLNILHFQPIFLVEIDGILTQCNCEDISILLVAMFLQPSQRVNSLFSFVNVILVMETRSISMIIWRHCKCPPFPPYIKTYPNVALIIYQHQLSPTEVTITGVSNKRPYSSKTLFFPKLVNDISLISNPAKIKTIASTVDYKYKTWKFFVQRIYNYSSKLPALLFTNYSNNCWYSSSLLWQLA